MMLASGVKFKRAMLGSVAIRRMHRVLSACIEEGNAFSLSCFQTPSRTFPQVLPSRTTCMYTSPVILQMCRRHSSISTKTLKNVDRYFISHQSLPLIPFQPQTHSLSKLTPYGQCFAQLSSSTGTHKRAGSSSSWDRANRTTATYMAALAIAVVGLSYAAVPLYRIFCQASGYGGTVNVVDPSDKVEHMEPLRERELTIRFNADTSAAMRWQFKPHQREIKLVPGETALAFYTARNPTDRPVTGIATYNVIPFEAGLYFNKIQCFCFEEQRLNPREQVDMPVFFYIDPEFNEDPAMAKVDTITLSYTFFEAKEGEQLTLPLPHSAPNS